jgi:hypothetical protein
MVRRIRNVTKVSYCNNHFELQYKSVFYTNPYKSCNLPKIVSTAQFLLGSIMNYWFKLRKQDLCNDVLENVNV